MGCGEGRGKTPRVRGGWRETLVFCGVRGGCCRRVDKAPKRADWGCRTEARHREVGVIERVELSGRGWGGVKDDVFRRVAGKEMRAGVLQLKGATGVAPNGATPTAASTNSDKPAPPA